jgi:hypothetical protein
MTIPNNILDEADLTATTPTGPQTRDRAEFVSIPRSRRLRYWRRGTESPYTEEAYAGHNMVTFQNGDYLYGVDVGTVTTSGHFLACKINLPSYPASTSWGIFARGYGDSGTVGGLRVFVKSNGTLEILTRDAGNTAPIISATSRNAIGTGAKTIHVSVDATAGAAESDAGSLTGTTITLAGITGPILSTWNVARNNVPQTHGVDYTITGANQLTFAVAGSGIPLEDDVAVLGLSKMISCWIDGTAQVMDVGTETLTDTSWDLSAVNARKVVIGSRFNAGTTPTFTTGGYLGYVDGTAPNDVAVEMGFLIYDHAANPDPTTTSNNGADIDLSAFESAGATPARLFFGGLQTAADWNAGTNLGSASTTWTMTGAAT